MAKPHVIVPSVIIPCKTFAMLTSLTQTARTSRASGFVGRLVTLIPMLDYSWTLLCGWVVHNIEFIISTSDVLDGGRHSLEDHVHDLRVNHLV